MSFGVMMTLSGLMSRCTMPLGVGLGEGVGNLRREIDRAPRVERTPGDDVLQRLAGHELEGEKELPLVLADLVERRDVRVRERRRRSGFAKEPLAAIGIAGQLGGHHLDRDGAAETCVAGAIDLAHPAGADPVEDLVLPEGLEHRLATIILTGP